MCCKVKSLLSGHYNSPSSLRPHEESPCHGVNSNGLKISRITTANILDNYKDHVGDMKLGGVLCVVASGRCPRVFSINSIYRVNSFFTTLQLQWGRLLY